MLLFLWAAMSMAYYVAGTAALNEKWFHGERHGKLPFGVHDDRSLVEIEKEAREAGLQTGDILETLNGAQYTGYFQFFSYLSHARPDDVAHLRVRRPNGEVRSAAIRLKPWPGPSFSFGGYVAFLTAVLGVTLLACWSVTGWSPRGREIPMRG